MACSLTPANAHTAAECRCKGVPFTNDANVSLITTLLNTTIEKKHTVGYHIPKGIPYIFQSLLRGVERKRFADKITSGLKEREGGVNKKKNWV